MDVTVKPLYSLLVATSWWMLWDGQVKLVSQASERVQAVPQKVGLPVYKEDSLAISCDLSVIANKPGRTTKEMFVNSEYRQ